MLQNLLKTNMRFSTVLKRGAQLSAMKADGNQQIFQNVQSDELDFLFDSSELSENETIDSDS